MDYEEIMLMKQNREAEQSKEAIRNHNARAKAFNEKAEYNNIWDKLSSLNTDDYDYGKFKKKVTDAYIVEGLTVLVDNCVNPILIRETYNQKLVRQLVTNFVKENDSQKILNDMRRKSYLLSEMAYIIDNQIKTVLEKADKNNSETFKIDNEDKEKFYDKLAKVDVDKSIDTITNRVREQTTDFVNSNMEEKAQLSASLSKTQKKVEDNKEKLKEKANTEKNREEAEKIEESYISLGKRRAVDIRENRTKNIFEHMVHNLSKASIVNENANRAFTKDSKLDMDKIVEHCEVICTFVTALDSLKLINVNESYIKNMLNDMRS